jgi:hypothetical protein
MCTSEQARRRLRRGIGQLYVSELVLGYVEDAANECVGKVPDLRIPGVGLLRLRQTLPTQECDQAPLEKIIKFAPVSTSAQGTTSCASIVR